jgi:hypothetical protein
MNFVTIFDIVYLTALLALLVCMFILSVIRSRRDQRILQILVDVSDKNAESNRQLVKATQNAIDLLNEVLHGHNA